MNRESHRWVGLGLSYFILWSALTMLIGSVALGHGGRHPERVDQRDAGWLSRLGPAQAVLWASPTLLKDGRVQLVVHHTFKGELLPATLEVSPVSVSRAKAQGPAPQLIFLTNHQEEDQEIGWHWSIGRHDLELKSATLAIVESYIGLSKLMEDGRCSGQLAEILAGITYQTPTWQSKVALLDAFGICKSLLPRLTKTSRAYLREAQRRHQSGHRRASPGKSQNPN